MNCFHCNYPLSSQGYKIFDENYNFEIYEFCSLNCGLKYIVDSKENLVKKLRNFFNFYNIDSKTLLTPESKIPLKQALPFERLKVFDGDLSYKDYRKDFITPNFYYDSYDIQNESFITYEAEYTQDHTSSVIEENDIIFLNEF